MREKIAGALLVFLLSAGVALAQAAPPPLPGQARAAASEWYFAIDGRQQGPMSLEDILERGVAEDALLWREGMADWAIASEVPEFRELTARAREVDTTEYFIERDGSPDGPFDRDAVKARLESGAVRPDTLVWHEGLEAWEPLSETRLSSLLPATTGAPPGLPSSPSNAVTGPGRAGAEIASATPSPASADAVVGRWEGRIRQAIDSLPDPIDIDLSLVYSPDGRLSGSGVSIVDLRAQGVEQPVRMEISVAGDWTAEPLGGDRLRLRTMGSMTVNLPEFGMPEERESFDETEIVDLGEPGVMRYEDGRSLRRTSR